MKRDTAQAEFDWDAQAATEEQEPEPAPASTASTAILERIKKLLRLAADQRGNPHEAERAAALAFELAEKHHVDLAGLDLDEKVEQVLGEYFQLGARLDRISQGALRIVRSFFHVSTCLDFPKVLFVGRQTDVAIAGYVFDFLRRTGRECLRAFEAGEKAARRKLNLTKRANYVAGFFWAITQKLGESRETLQLDFKHNALVLAEQAKREAKLAELVPNTSAYTGPRKTGTNRSALFKGIIDGRRTQINTPLSGPGQKDVLGLPA